MLLHLPLFLGETDNEVMQLYYEDGIPLNFFVPLPMRYWQLSGEARAMCKGEKKGVTERLTPRQTNRPQESLYKR
jgi:hypothetical protein